MLNALTKNLFQLPRGPKRAIQVGFDVLAMALCFWLAMVLRLDGIATTLQPQSWAVLLAVVPVTIAAFVALGLYRAVIRFMADRALKTVSIGVAVSAVTMFATSQYLDLFVPRSVPGIYFAMLLIVTGGTRMIVRSIYLTSKDEGREPVLIYGAGDADNQLLQALDQSRNYRPAIFVDDDKKMHGAEIGGVRVIRPALAAQNIKALGIKTALLAMSNANAEGRRRAARMLSDLGLEVRVIPNVSDLVSGRIRMSELRRVTVEELLGRDPVPPIPKLMSKTTKGKSVMVTGAGGSIGSELCRQIMSQGPARLVLFDVSEYALYRIHEELTEASAAAGGDCVLVPVLGSVVRKDLVARTITDNAIETLFHAAAYKHVPLVEANVVAGVRNNVFGTEAVAGAAGELGVKTFTLISTDKAVRPTNVMGATKRLAELVMQAKAREHPGTKYCAVRFGNVLGSSGSVIPKFEKQIAAGGPITLTHPNITRYFMTIPEAAQLVVQASAMAKRGEIYLLDMGEPIKILDLAKTMARLHGREAFLEGAETAGPGALPIKVTGLRPGEKLYEELLVTGSETATDHTRVKCEGVEVTGIHAVDDWLASLSTFTSKSDEETLAEALEQLPLGFQRDRATGVASTR
ncbi:MAG: nucleoside-diphosphate sugar epimerase/dehydratase [Roseovarius sp.]